VEVRREYGLMEGGSSEAGMRGNSGGEGRDNQWGYKREKEKKKKGDIKKKGNTRETVSEDRSDEI